MINQHCADVMKYCNFKPHNITVTYRPVHEISFTRGNLNSMKFRDNDIIMLEIETVITTEDGRKKRAETTAGDGRGCEAISRNPVLISSRPCSGVTGS